MSWFKIDDSFSSHPKVLSIPRKQRLAAIGLWTLAGAWCAQQLTDGNVGDHMVGEFGASQQSADHLVASGLWDKVAGGYNFHDWKDWQPTRADVHERRAVEAKRKQDWRDRKREKRESHGGVPPVSLRDTSVSPGGVPDSSALPDPTRPDPTVLPTEVQETTRPTSSADADAAFETFWADYPRKVGKAAGRKAWNSATKTNSAQDITAGLRAQLPLLLASEEQFQPHAATWLNAGRWQDEPPATPRRVNGWWND